MISNPYQKYQQSSIQTAPGAQLLLMLYDGAIRFVKLGIEGIDHRDIEKANRNLNKAQSIIHELIASLEFEYPIASDLARIYDYFLHRLITANMEKSREPAIEVLDFLTELKGAWSQAAKSGSTAKQAGHG